ncbi:MULTISPECIES: hypothetical protein [Clavibacter]|nr:MULTISPECIES: hypothetical protein [Clavibacter]MDO4027189.1 hypothetical protein [Clavibacter michiganensis]MDO4030228.1 hypothetical protein [Clavibacter michiganensis]MDO4045697.1 hypothetical protein [Clavibacter michiganensis]MDO4054760.1 hypothetical protein [Clavibacter michiganensis]MDO4058123.1 hypothetical protein [Clavibacter michiganensis]
MARIGRAITTTAESVQEVADAYRTARRERDEAIVASVAVLGQKGAAEAAGLSRRRVRQLLDEAHARQENH